MGGESSKSDIAGDGRAGRRGSTDAINAVFVANVGGHRKMTERDFIKLFGVCQEVGELMFKYICRRHGIADRLKASDYVASVQNIVELDGEANPMNFYINVLSLGDSLTQSDMKHVLRLCCDAEWSVITGRKSFHEDPMFVLLAQNALGANNQTVSSMRFHSWCTQNCSDLFTGLHSIILSRLTDQRQYSTAEACSVNSLVENCQSEHSVVSTSWIWFLTYLLDAYFIPSGSSTATRLMRVCGPGGWHFIYDSNSQGLSVNRFEHHVIGYGGPSLLFISFQNFLCLVAVDCPWKESHQRWGGSGCMLVQLKPEYRIIRTGSGLIYFNLSDRSLPKGISVGQDRTTILTVDGALEKVNYLGADYHINSIEVWGCGGRVAQESQQKQKAWEQHAVTKEQDRKLVSGGWRENEDRALLEMGGIDTHHNDRQEM